MHRKMLFEQYGDYDNTYRIVGDYEFLLRAGEKLHAAFLPQVTTVMRGGGASDSSAALDEAARAKMQTGRRSHILVAGERLWAKAKFFTRRGVQKGTPGRI
jgi:hypothetical protein